MGLKIVRLIIGDGIFRLKRRRVYEPIIEIKILLYGIIKIGFNGLDARAVNNSYGNTDTF